MNKSIFASLAALALLTSCTMNNPLLKESELPYGAPQFDKIQNCHYLPAFKKAIARNKAEIDAITECKDAPDFENTIVALENSGRKLSDISAIFFNLLEADADDEMQAIAEELNPMLNEIGMYALLNEKLFARIKSVYEARESMGLDRAQLKLLEDCYKSYCRSGANLNAEDKETFKKLSEELSLATLKFGNNVRKATNAWNLNLTDEADLAGLPDYIVELGRQTAEEKGQEGWTYDLSAPSYRPFMQYSDKRELREKMYMAYNTRAVGGEFDNTALVKQIASLRLQIAQLLGFSSYADYALEERMLKTPAQVEKLLSDLMTPSLPKAMKEVDDIFRFARKNGFEDECLRSWDFSYWQEKYKNEMYSFNESELKPYFKLESCIDAVLGLAGRLYGLTFQERTDIPGYHEDVKVFDVKNESGKHLALFYADFFPRESKRGGAWMTEFRGQSIVDGVEYRPFISIVTNFSKPTGDEPSLLTHDELETFLHEFGHALHGILAQGRYISQTGTNVSRDFVELPSQIMENWAYEPAYLQSFAKNYKTGEPIPTELIEKIVAAKNYTAAYLQVRQLHFGILDMAWHSLASMTEEETLDFEKKALAPYLTFPEVPGTSISTSITHLFSGGYAAGYYSYKWAEVLEADAFSLFKEQGIFNRVVSNSFRDNILSRGSSEDEAVLYRNFRGHDPEVSALLKKLGIE